MGRGMRWEMLTKLETGPNGHTHKTGLGKQSVRASESNRVTAYKVEILIQQIIGSDIVANRG